MRIYVDEGDQENALIDILYVVGDASHMCEKLSIDDNKIKTDLEMHLSIAIALVRRMLIARQLRVVNNGYDDLPLSPQKTAL